MTLSIKKLLGFVVVLVSLGALSGTAIAQSYSFSYVSTTGGPASVSGVFDIGAANGTGFDITSISGTVTSAIGGGPITGLLPADPSSPGGFSSDNILFPAADPLLSVLGAFFTTGTDEWNLWGLSPGIYNLWHSTLTPGVTQYDVQTTGTLSITAVPEPGTYALMFAGLGVVTFIARRRRPNQA